MCQEIPYLETYLGSYTILRSVRSFMSEVPHVYNGVFAQNS